jgi:hypothetical protein
MPRIILVLTSKNYQKLGKNVVLNLGKPIATGATLYPEGLKILDEACLESNQRLKKMSPLQTSKIIESVGQSINKADASYLRLGRNIDSKNHKNEISTKTEDSNS